MNEYFVPMSNIQGGDNIFWIAQLSSLLIWSVLIYRYYYLPQHHQNNPITNILLFIPVLGLLYNVYLGYNHKGPSPPRSWNFCLDTKVTPKDKDKGVVGYFDYTCLSNHLDSMVSDNGAFTKRLYYLNYLLFFVILVIESAYSSKMFSKTKSMLINLLGMDCILVIIGSIVPLFSGSPIWSYIILSFLSGILWMSSALLLIIMVDMYKYLVTGSHGGRVWKKR